MLIENITVVIIAKNAEDIIYNTLDSLKLFNEVILYLNNTSDNTKNIASTFSNVKIIEGEFVGFGETKNKALSFSKNEWIFSLDADEVLNDNFISSLRKLELTEDTVYSIHRTNYYKNIQIKHCWSDDIIVRLFNKNKTKFCNNKVHEYVIKTNFKTKLINGTVRHYPYTKISDFIVKLDRYSSLFAQENVGNKTSSPLKAISSSIYAFFKIYFIKKGFLDGWIGLVISFSRASVVFFKYIKLYELNKENLSK